MKKIILRFVILVAFVFSFDKSFGKGCRVHCNVGTVIGDIFHPTYILHLDTLYNVGDTINLSVRISLDMGPCQLYLLHTNIDSSHWIWQGWTYTFTIVDTGTYIISMTTTDSNPIDDTITVGYRTATSLPEFSSPNILQIYPNPTNNTFTIKNISSKGKTLMEIINVFGEVVYKKELYGKKEYLIDEHFAKGIYFVRMNDGESNVVRKLIIE
jgi:hypothetical protein